jgi:hypothetical protein
LNFFLAAILSKEKGAPIYRDSSLPRKFLWLTFNLVALLESLDASLRIQHTPLTREERVAIAAYLDLKLLLGGTGGKSIPAGTDNLGIGIVLGMNLFFHITQLT